MIKMRMKLFVVVLINFRFSYFFFHYHLPFLLFFWITGANFIEEFFSSLSLSLSLFSLLFLCAFSLFEMSSYMVTSHSWLKRHIIKQKGKKKYDLQKYCMLYGFTNEVNIGIIIYYHLFFFFLNIWNKKKERSLEQIISFLKN